MKNNYSLFIRIFISSIMVPIGCKSAIPTPDGGTSGSGLSSANIEIPADFPLRDKLTGYTLLIAPKTCPAGVTGTKINETKKMSDTIAEKVVSACDYTFTLSLGLLTGNSSKLASVYFESAATVVSKDQLKVSPASISIKLKTTPAGKAAGAPDGTVTTPASSNVTIKPELDSSPNISADGGTNIFSVTSGKRVITVPNDFGSLDTRKPEDACNESKLGTFAFSADGAQSWVCEPDLDDRTLVWIAAGISKTASNDSSVPLAKIAWYQYERNNQLYIGHVAIYEKAGSSEVSFIAGIHVLPPNTKTKDCSACKMHVSASVKDKQKEDVRLFSSDTINDQKILQPVMKYENGRTRVYLNDENARKQELIFAFLP